MDSQRNTRKMVRNMRKKLQRFLLWNYFLGKRFLKKPMFLAILCFIPLLALLLKNESKEQSGVLTIALCQLDEQDELSSKIIENLVNQKSILQYKMVSNEEEAYQAVRTAIVDAAWIFQSNMGETLSEYSISDFITNPLVTIVEREEDVYLQLSREKLYAAIFPYYSYELYENYIEYVVCKDGVVESREKLPDYYKVMGKEDGIIEFAYIDDTKIDMRNEQNYLIAPLRGLLALILTICGFASYLYYLEDKAKKLFQMLSSYNKRIYQLAYPLVGIFLAGIAMYVSLALVGMIHKPGEELLFLFLLMLASTAFCALIGRSCGSVRRLTALIPFLLLAQLFFSPIFFSVRKLRKVSYLFPAFYYLDGQHNRSFIYELGIYTILILFVYFIPFRKST